MKLHSSISSSVLVALSLGMAPIAVADLPYQGEGHIMVQPSDLEWKPVGSMSPGAEITVLEGDLGKEAAFTMRLKMPANYDLMPHTHPEYERVTVLSGTFHFAHGKEFDADGLRTLPTGSFAVMAPGEPMYGRTGKDEVVIQLHGTGPWGIEYIDPSHDPRK
ncbi:cupin domain-containing protein [Marinobacter sp.]|uniref:cupin domain-containing protein n=1 Tax=Marinobacter sp. TaxID=50741 RepID=UPI00384CB374